jgi:hypothetical protein
VASGVHSSDIQGANQVAFKGPFKWQSRGKSGGFQGDIQVVVRGSLKGQSHEIFDPRFFSPIKPPYVTNYLPKIFLNSVSISPRYREFVSTPRYAA